MIPAVTYRGKRVAVFGLGASGRATVRALEAAGAEVLVWDDSESSRKTAGDDGAPLNDLREINWSGIDALVLAPGVPLTHPEPHWTVKLAHRAEVPVIGDTELFVQALAEAGCKTRLIAITGTNGKSTTTALISHILNSTSRDTEVGGNIGTAVLELTPPADEGHYVVEFSSYQIDLTPSLKPDAGILLNLSPDHLDRHGGMAGYAAVKARLFSLQTSDDIAAIGVDDNYCRAIADQLKAPNVQRISVRVRLETGVTVLQGQLVQTLDGKELASCQLEGIEGLRGSHNWQNAAAAWAVCRSLGLTPSEIESGFRSFLGLAHRMEQVGRSGDIIFINDTKATNADAAARALDSFENIYWLAGGQAKDGGIESLEEYFPRIRRAYLMGEAAGLFASTLKGKVEAVDCGTIDCAVSAAFQDAIRAGGAAVILLSPACASFDQFRNFEIRGEAFRSAVAGLKGVAMKTQEVA